MSYFCSTCNVATPTNCMCGLKEEYNLRVILQMELKTKDALIKELEDLLRDVKDEGLELNKDPHGNFYMDTINPIIEYFKDKI